MWFLAVIIILVLVLCLILWRVSVSRALHLWYPDYLRTASRRRRLHPTPPVHVMFCLVDHFEPCVGHADESTQTARVQTWLDRLPLVLKDFRDADGLPPVHTMFYPIDELHPVHLQSLRPLTDARLVNLEIHLHHDHDTPNFLATLDHAKSVFASNGYLCRTRTDSAVRFAFIHGNWALANSRPDGRWCGLNDELRLLERAGCYADFTFPSAPSLTQPRTVNRIYYAASNPDRPRSADHGLEVRLGGSPSGNLMIIPGPLCLNWRRRKFGLLPRLENSELTPANPPTPERIDLWLRQHIHVPGRPEWIFVKLHAHGAREDNAQMLLGPQRHLLHETLQTRYNDGRRFLLHYVSAREMCNIVKAAEAGLPGSPNDFRDFLLLPMNR